MTSIPGGLRRAAARRRGGEGQRGRLAGNLGAQVTWARLLPGRRAIGRDLTGAEVHAPAIGCDRHQVQPRGLQGADRRNVHHSSTLQELADVVNLSRQAANFIPLLT